LKYDAQNPTLPINDKVVDYRHLDALARNKLAALPPMEAARRTIRLHSLLKRPHYIQQKKTRLVLPEARKRTAYIH